MLLHGRELGAHALTVRVQQTQTLDLVALPARTRSAYARTSRIGMPVPRSLVRSTSQSTSRAV